MTMHEFNTLSTTSDEAAAVSRKNAASAGCRDLLTSLHQVATGRIGHIYNGLCPDSVEGPDVRDIDCPACRVLLQADRELSR